MSCHRVRVAAGNVRTSRRADAGGRVVAAQDWWSLEPKVRAGRIARWAARIEVRRLTKHAMSVDYEAVGVAGLQHVEHTIVSASGLHVATSEFSDVVAFRRVAAGHFVGDAAGFAMEIHAGWDGDSLTWAWHWAPPGQSLREQSRATARQVS